MKSFYSSYKSKPKLPLLTLVVLIGDVGVGKTCITKRFIDEKMPPNSLPTIGIEFAKKMVTLKNGSKMNVQIWDTGNPITLHNLTLS